MAHSEVRTRNNQDEQRYEARLDDGLVGFADYRLGDGVITFVHTEVDDDLEGAGIASALARGALDDVRREGSRRVIAKCPFIAEWIDRHPDYQDLLA